MQHGASTTGALQSAVTGKRIGVVKYLLKKNAVGINDKSKYFLKSSISEEEVSALDLAVRFKYVRMTKLLLLAGADGASVAATTDDAAWKQLLLTPYKSALLASFQTT